MNAAKLYGIYKARRERIEARFPGSVVAGPARYPVERHNKAWASVDKAYTAYIQQKEREEASQRHQAKMDRIAQETTAMLNATNSPLAAAAIGSKARLFWTNCGSAYSAVVKVVKINARTFVIELVDDVPAGYEKGQRWPIDKLKRTQQNRLELLN